jgi:hypothetical protein
MTETCPSKSGKPGVQAACDRVDPQLPSQPSAERRPRLRPAHAPGIAARVEWLYVHPTFSTKISP